MILKPNPGGKLPFAFGDLITDFTRGIIVGKEAKSVIEKFNGAVAGGATLWEDISGKIGVTNATMSDYLKTVGTGTATVEGYKTHMRSLGTAFDFTALKAKALNIALSVLPMLAISFAVKAVMMAFDKWNVTLEEHQAKVDALTESYNSLKTELEDLKNKSKLTDEEKEYVNHLERRVDLEKILLQNANKKKAASEIYGKGDIFSGGIVADDKKSWEQFEGVLVMNPDTKQFEQVRGQNYDADLKMEDLAKVRSEIAGLDKNASDYQKTLKSLTNQESDYTKSLKSIKSIADAYAAIAKARQTSLAKIGVQTTSSPVGDALAPLKESYMSTLFAYRKDAEDATLVFTKAVEEIDKDLNKVKNLRSGKVSGGSPDKEKSSGGKDKKEEDLNKKAFEDSLATLKYNLEMELITEKEYYQSLDGLYKKHFSDKTKYLDEYRQYEVEVYKGMKQLREQEFNDATKSLEHTVSVLDRSEGNEETQAQIYSILQQKIQDEIDWFLEQGLTGWADEITSLESKLWDYQDKENDIYKSLLDERVDSYKDYIDQCDEYNRWGSDNETRTWERLRGEVEEYYLAGKISAKDYAEYVKEINEGVASSTKSMYEKYRDAMVDEIEKNIDKLDDNLEKQNQSYEDRIDALKNLEESQSDDYDKRIDALKEEKQLLSDEADEADRLLKIEKARQDLEKAKSQETKQIYREGIGLVYEQDDDAIRDAQNTLDDLLDEYKRLQEESAIDEQIDNLEKLKDSNKESIESQIDELERLKQANEDSIKAQIVQLEDLKTQWEDSLDVSESIEDLQGTLIGLTEFEKLEFDKRLLNAQEFAKAYTDEMKKISDLAANPYGVSSGDSFYANQDGSAPSNAKVGDKILTGGGTYQIVPKGTEGSSYNSESGLSSIKIDDLSTAINNQNAGLLAQTEATQENTSVVASGSKAVDKSASATVDNTKETKTSTSATQSNTTSVDSNSTYLSTNTSEISGNSTYLMQLNSTLVTLESTLRSSSEMIAEAAQVTIEAADRAERAARKPASASVVESSHSGGIVGVPKKHQELIDLSKQGLKSDERLMVTQLNEGIFTTEQMDNLYQRVTNDELSPIALTPDLSNIKLTTSPFLAGMNITPNAGNETINHINVTADFSGVESAAEIKKAIMTLPQRAKQWIGRD